MTDESHKKLTGKCSIYQIEMIISVNKVDANILEVGLELTNKIDTYTHILLNFIEEGTTNITFDYFQTEDPIDGEVTYGDTFFLFYFCAWKTSSISLTSYSSSFSYHLQKYPLAQQHGLPNYHQQAESSQSQFPA